MHENQTSRLCQLSQYRPRLSQKPGVSGDARPTEVDPLILHILTAERPLKCLRIALNSATEATRRR